MDLMHHNSFISSFKLYFKRTIGIVLVIGVIAGFIYYYDRITFTGSTTYELYYIDEPNTIDVACFGTSHVYLGINPVLMWDDYGIRGAVFGAGSQPAWSQYAYLCDVLKTQKPELVVYDVYQMGYGKYTNEDYDIYTEKTIIGLRPSFSKAATLYDVYENYVSSEEGMRWNLIWLLPTNHTKYKTLQMRLYKNDIKYRHDALLGYWYENKSVPAPAESHYDYHPENCKDVIPCVESEERYLRKAIELCQSKDVPIVLTNVFTTTTSDEHTGRYNYIRQVASEYGVDFVNGCEYFEQIGIDEQTDYQDGGNHLNYYGAQKFTKWLVDNVILNYDITIHSSDDTKNKIWDITSAALHERVACNEIVKSKDYGEIMGILNDTPGFSYIIIDNRNGMGETTFVDEGVITAKYDNSEQFHHVQYYDAWNLRVVSDGEKQNVEINKGDNELSVAKGQFGLVVYEKDGCWFRVMDIIDLST